MGKKTKKTRRTRKEPWDRKRPAAARHTRLTPKSRQRARQRARRAGRPYPNLVDNMQAAKDQGRSRKRAPSRKGSAAPRRRNPSRRQ